MSVPQLTISLSPQGELVIELPGLNGSRRKINLQDKSLTTSTIEDAIECIKSFQDFQNLWTEFNLLASKTTHVGSKEEKEKNLAEMKLNSARLKMDAANQTIAALSSILSSNDTTTGIIHKILNGQQTNKNQIGEDGNPTEQQVRHWQKHSNIFGDPSCPFCIAEGKFEKGKNREDTRSLRGLTEHEALRLGLISRGYVANKNNLEIYSKKNMGNLRLTPNCKIIDHKQIEISRENKNDILKDGKIYASRHGFVKHSPIKTKSITVKHIKKMVKETQIERLTRNPVILPL